MSIMYSHTSHHASLPTLGPSSEESGFLSHLIAELPTECVTGLQEKPTKEESHLLEQSPKQSEGVPSQQTESSDKLQSDEDFLLTSCI